MSDPRQDAESLHALYDYWVSNDEYDETAQQYVEYSAQQINAAELSAKLAESEESTEEESDA